MRYRVTVEFNVSASSVDEAKAKAQKLADVLNERDENHRAWVKMMKSNIGPMEGDMYKGKPVV